MNPNNRRLLPAFVSGVALLLINLTLIDKRSVNNVTPTQPMFGNTNKVLIARGERIVQMNCAHCHGNNEGRLAGQLISGVQPSLGRIVSANITKDSVQGIGAWSDAQLIRLIRTGIDPKGHKAHFIMPRYPLMADVDMQAIVAFLRSNEYAVQATIYEGQASKPSLLSNFIRTFFIKRLPEPGGPVPLPDTTKPVLYGGYLVNNLYQCYACHSDNVQKTNVLKPTATKGYLAGGAKLLDEDNSPVYSANLTPDTEMGIGRYTEAEFSDVMRIGKKRTGQIIRQPMLPYPLLTDREIRSIYAYLKSVPAVHHAVLPK